MQEGGSARDMRRGHAGAAECCPEPFTTWNGRENALAGSGHVGLHAQGEWGGPGRRERGDHRATLFALGRDRDRAVRAAGRRHRSRAELLEVVPRRDDGDDSGGSGAVERRGDDVAARVDLDLSEREVDDVHPVADSRFDAGDDLCRVPIQPEAARHGQHLVVAEIGLGRDSGDPAARGLRPVVAGGDSGDVRRMVRVERIEGPLGVLPLWRARGEGSSDDHLRARQALLALGKAARHPVAARAEVRVGLVEPVVDDADLHAVPGRAQRLPPERRRADESRAGRAERAVADVRVDAHDAVRALERSPARSRATSRRGRRGRSSSGAEPRDPRCDPSAPTRPTAGSPRAS